MKFDAQQIAGAGEALLRMHKTFSNQLYNIAATMALKEEWQGECADLFLKRCATLQKQGEALAQRMQAFGTRLCEISGIYEGGVKVIGETIDSTQIEVVEL